MNNFDTDINMAYIDDNCDYIHEACNTAILDISELTIIDTLPESKEYYSPMHLSLLSKYATSDRDDFLIHTVRGTNVIITPFYSEIK